MPNAELRTIESVWGHLAGVGANPPDNEFVDAALNGLLSGLTCARQVTSTPKGEQIGITAPDDAVAGCMERFGVPQWPTRWQPMRPPTSAR